MRFPYCGLILSLSILLLATSGVSAKANDEALSAVQADEQKMPADTAVSETKTNSSPAIVQTTQPEPEAVNKKVQKDTNAPAEVPIIPIANTQQPEDLKEISNKVNTLDNQYLSLDERYQTLTVSLGTVSIRMNDIIKSQEKITLLLKNIEDKYSSSLSTYTVSSGASSDQIQQLINEQEKLVAMIAELSKNQNELKGQLDNVQKTKTSYVETKSTSSSLTPTDFTFEEMAGQQYMKLKFMQDGQEVELYLDPTYVDMNLDLTKFKKKEEPIVSKQPQQQVKEAEKTIDPEMARMMDYLSRQLESRSQAPMVVQSPASSPNPSITYNVQAPNMQQPQQVQPQPQMQQEQNQTPSYEQSLSQTESSGNRMQSTENPKAYEELFRAQKLFYSKKYNAALNSVHRSLSIQETPLAYALEGSLYFTMGDTELAISSWEQALRMNPNMAEVKKALFKYKR